MRVAAYIRVSTEEQAIHGLSVEAQQTALTEWVKQNGHELVDVYNDAGISARKPAAKRPDLQRLLRDVADRRIDLVVFTKLDRWFRNIAEYYKAQEILEKYSVPWKAIHEDYETQTASGRLKVNIMLSVAQDEADRTGERIKTVFAAKKLRGEVCSGKVPVGLKIVDKHIVPTDDAWKVKETFDLFLAARSVEETIRKSPTGLSRGGVKYMLRNHRFVDAGVISQDIFDKVQRILDCRCQRTVPGTRRVYLFSGLVFCQGKRANSHATVINGRTYYRYRSARSGSMCTISEPKLEAYLLQHVISQLDAMAVFSAKKEKPVDPAAVKRKMDRLTDLLLRDLISQDKYEVEYRALQSQLRPPQKHRVDRQEILSALSVYGSLSREGKKAFWSNIIERIDYDPATSEIRFSLYP